MMFWNQKSTGPLKEGLPWFNRAAAAQQLGCCPLQTDQPGTPPPRSHRPVTSQFTISGERTQVPVLSPSLQGASFLGKPSLSVNSSILLLWSLNWVTLPWSSMTQPDE